MTATRSELPLDRLLEGNRRFRAARLAHPDESVTRRHQLVGAQHPFAVILGCSDSRVPPEIVFDEGLGDLFVVRVAGNILDDAVVGSIEYAVEHLGARLVMVMGHESCGAVTAAVLNQREAHITALVDAIKPVVEGEAARQAEGHNLNDRAFVDRVVRANVKRVVDQLKVSEPLLTKAIAGAGLQIVGGYYQLETGEVSVIA